MGFTFLSKAASEALKSKESLVGLLTKNMGGYQKERSHAVVHASDVTKPEFCARQYALLDKTEKERSPVYISAALQATFDVGRAVSDLLREKWLRQHAIGNWCCLRCGTQRTFCEKPVGSGCDAKDGGHHRWQYVEMEFELPDYGISGSIDVFAQLGGLKIFPIEVKIIAPQEWEKLVAPLFEHRVRTNLYMHLIEHSDSPYKTQINTKEARVVYVSRAYGKMDATHKQILPFKEFTVNRSEVGIVELLDKAHQVKFYRDTGTFPKGICASHGDKIAKKCPVAKECFSGNYPAGGLCAS